MTVKDSTEVLFQLLQYTIPGWLAMSLQHIRQSLYHYYYFFYCTVALSAVHEFTKKLRLYIFNLGFVYFRNFLHYLGLDLQAKFQCTCTTTTYWVVFYSLIIYPGKTQEVGSCLLSLHIHIEASAKVSTPLGQN